MNATTQPNRYALILDKETIQSVLERAEQWHIKPRLCRPLDTFTGKGYSVELRGFDEEIDACAIAEEELPVDSIEESLFAAEDISEDLGF